MSYKFNKIIIYFTFLCCFLISIQSPAAENETENILHKVELVNANYKTIIIKLFTAEKYQILPTPIKKDRTEYALFLPGTREKLKNQPSIKHLKGIIEEVKIEYIPLLSSQSGYTKIFISSSSPEVDLFVENHLYKATAIKKENLKQKKIKKAQKNIKIEKNLNNNPKKTNKNEKKKENPSQVKQKTIKASPKETKYRVKEIKIQKKDYSIGIYTALILIFANIAYVYIKRKQKLTYDGKLSGELKKQIPILSSKEYVLFFSEDISAIKNFYNYCEKNNINLKIASKNPQIFEETFTAGKTTFFEPVMFNWEEFYKHKTFYEKLEPKPAVYVFDIDTDLKINKDNNFNFINSKKHIDINYTNLFLILNLIVKDLNKNESSLIFTGKKLTGFSQEKYKDFDSQVKIATKTAIEKFIFNIKKSNPNKKIYCLFKDI